MALAGFDAACWDALSLAAGLPLVSYIGSQPRSVQAYDSNGLGLMPPEQAADEASALLEHGFARSSCTWGARPRSRTLRWCVRFGVARPMPLH